MQNNTVKQLLYFYFLEINWHKQWVIAAYDENATEVFKKTMSHNVFSGYCAPNTNLRQTQTIFMQCRWVFSTPYSTLLITDVATEVARRFVRKKQIVQHEI
jgi:exosortase/archaeosortase